MRTGFYFSFDFCRKRTQKCLGSLNFTHILNARTRKHPSIFFFLQVFFFFVRGPLLPALQKPLYLFKKNFFHSFCFFFLRLVFFSSSSSFFRVLHQYSNYRPIYIYCSLPFISFLLPSPETEDSNRQEPTLAHSTASRLFGLPDLTGVVPPSSQYFQLMEAAPVAPIVQLNSPVMARDGRRFVPGDPSPTRH